jgi:hypothetical protein
VSRSGGDSGFDRVRQDEGRHGDSTLKAANAQIIEHLHSVADFYGYKPGVGSLLAAAH